MGDQKIESHFSAFGELLARRRVEAGIAGQAKLASLMRVQQQTVSRWELGQSRPRRSEIDRLAGVLKINAEELASAAGYSTSLPIVSYDEPFPLGSLSPDKFERFALFFLDAAYRPARVHRAGNSGHEQDGLDVEVEFDDGKTFHFQCKRVQDFGAAKVRSAVEKYKRKAAQKIILLSRVASPKARDAIRAYKGWDIWDQEDVSLKIRQLPRQIQLELVDIFFRGMRLPLLGEGEANVWQTPDVFFAPFSVENAAFTHTWSLVGRSGETEALLGTLRDLKIAVTFLVAPGGGGKSRVLRLALDKMQAARPDVLVRILAPTEELTNKSLEDLGAGEKLLVVDDAHDRADLKLLFQYAANPANKAKLLIALRPYGVQYIRSQASNFALLGPRVATVELKPLSLADATKLAEQVFEKFSGPASLAKDVARLTLDCPLATVMGAWVVSKENKHFSLANNEVSFRELLMARFRDIIAGQVGRDPSATRKLLRVIALIQPFSIEDPSVFDAVAAVEGLQRAEVSRLFRELIEAGVLFRRGGRYRLSPDLLADYVIENECIDHNGISTGYAEQLFDAAGDALIEHIVLNLGRLDWRRANGDPSNSTLLDGIWLKLEPKHPYGDPYLRAVTAVAYYQPGRTLDFIERLMQEGRYLEELPDIIKFTSYSFPFLARACEDLWELGKNDVRPTNQHPAHPIRILSELSAVSQNKPYEYNEAIVDFALGLMKVPENWKHTHSPFDILGGITQTEGHSTSSDGRAMSFSPYFVRRDFVAALRTKIVTATIRLIQSDDLKVAVRAAKFVRSLLAYPMGQFGARASEETRKEWEGEFIETLSSLHDSIGASNLDNLVLVEIAQSISWHANYATGSTKSAAKRVFTLMNRDLEFRTLLAILDPWGHVFERRNSEATTWNGQADAIAKDIADNYPDGEALRQKLESVMQHIAAGGVQAEAGTLFFSLLQRSLPFARAIVENALLNPDSLTCGYAHTALGVILRSNSVEGLAYSSRFEDSNNTFLLRMLGAAYTSFDYSLDDPNQSHRSVLRRLITSPEPEVVQSAVRGISRIGEVDKKVALDLLLQTHFHQNPHIADNALSIFHNEAAMPFGLLSDSNAVILLAKLVHIPELDGHWIQHFLSEMSFRHPRECAQFFMRRVEYAAETKNWNFRPSNHGPYENVPLKFRKSPLAANVLRELLSWLKSRNDHLFLNRASELFETMFRPLDDEIVFHLSQWVDSADVRDIEIIGSLLREADRDFVFRQVAFVSRFLARAKQLGRKAHESATHQLYRASISGLKSGRAGEPFPEDIATKEKALKLVASLPRHAPERSLYQLLEQSADQDIQRSRQEAEMLDS